MRTFAAFVVTIFFVPQLSSPAEAANPPCASNAEYARVQKGMSEGRVIRIIGSKGKLLFRNSGVRHNSAREWNMCGSRKRMQVQMNNYRFGGPQLVVYKQRY